MVKTAEARASMKRIIEKLFGGDTRATIISMNEWMNEWSFIPIHSDLCEHTQGMS